MFEHGQTKTGRAKFGLLNQTRKTEENQAQRLLAFSIIMQNDVVGQVDASATPTFVEGYFQNVAFFVIAVENRLACYGDFSFKQPVWLVCLTTSRSLSFWMAIGAPGRNDKVIRLARSRVAESDNGDDVKG